MADPKNPGPEIDTGTGGFKPDGVSDKRFTYDPGSTDEPAGERPTWSPGQINVDASVRDVSPATKQTLASYLSKTTLGQTPSASPPRPNKYTISNDPGVTPASTSLTDTDGGTSPLTPYNSTSTQSHFADLTPGDGRSDKQGDLNIIRGAESPSTGATVDGHSLLSTAVEPPASRQVPPPAGEVNIGSLADDHPVKTYTESVLGGATDNKYDPSVTMISPRQVEGPGVPLPTYRSVVDVGTAARHLAAVTDGTGTAMGFNLLSNKYPVRVSTTSGSPIIFGLVTPEGYTQPLTQLSESEDVGELYKTKFVDTSKIPGRSAVTSVFNILRGREAPIPSTDPTKDKTQDGHDLLSTSATPATAAAVPPPRGTVNLTKLRPTSPVNYYTSKVLETQKLGVLTVDQLFSEPLNVLRPSTPVPRNTAGAAHHLSQMTKGELDSSHTPVDNAYPIENGPSEAPTRATLLDEKGYPAPLSAFSTGQRKFAEISDGRSSVAAALNILRGRQEPTPSTDPTKDKSIDGNDLLRRAVIPDRVASPPPAGTVNLGRLDPASPVKLYTDEAVKQNTFGSTTPYLQQQNSTALRAANELDRTPQRGMGPIPQDVPESRRKTLRQYLSDTTTNGLTPFKGNAYPVGSDDGGAAAVTESLLDGQGYAQAPHANSNSRKFVPDGTLSSRSDAGRPTALALSRSGPGEVDGHRLLRDITPELNGEGKNVNPSAIIGKGGFTQLPPITSVAGQGTSNISDYSAAVTLNRFSADGGFEATGERFATKYTAGSYVGEGQWGLKFKRLAQVGNSLMLAASTEISGDPGENPSNGTAEAASMLPGLGTQLLIPGMRPDRTDFEAGRFIEALEDPRLGDVDDNLITNPAGLSWGVLNNMHEKFDSVANFGQILLAVALLVALTVALLVIMGLFFIVTLGSSFGPGSEKASIDGQLPYGAFQWDPKFEGGSRNNIMNPGNFNLAAAMGFAPSKFDFYKSLTEGALVFFGLKSIGDAIVNLSESTGHSVIMARLVIRSLTTIGDAFIDMGKAFAAANVFSGISQVLGIMGVFRESKLMKAVRIFVQYGDRSLESSEDSFDDRTKGPTKKFTGKIDRAGNDDSTVLKGRLKVSPEDVAAGIGVNTLSWASYRAPDLFIMPTSLKNTLVPGASSNVDNFLGIPSLLPRIPAGGSGLKYEIHEKEGKSRIDTKMREAMEDALEAEYMPFYLHDVRTNEIVSFHAFLASLSDDYTASYDSAEAFGRVEPIRTYKGTQRKVGFSFYVVATNPKDFNSMWMKINKLTTLVYPQFSEGRMVTYDNNTFRVPFSETIQASPLVRVRIGDVIRSNYSRFNLARLFGYGEPGTKFGGKEPEDSGWDAAGAIKEWQNQLKSGTRWRTNALLNDYVPKTLPIPIPGFVDVAPLPGISLPPVFSLEYEKAGPKPGQYILKVVESSPEDIEGNIAPSVIRDYVTIDERHPDNMKILGKSFLFNLGDLIPCPSTLKKIKQSSSAYNTAVLDYMNDDPSEAANKGNAIARAFRSTGGKGLAGFIESMGFDWYDRTTWEIGEGVGDLGPKLGRRAPKMCKVTVSFSPIHDITPGLDHTGANRAPIYPVGSHAAYDLRSKSS